MRLQRTKTWALGLGALLSTGATVCVAAGQAGARNRRASAHQASVLHVRDEGKLRLVKSSGSLLIDEGAVRGTIPGRVKVRFVYNGDPSVSAQITIVGHEGSIVAKGHAKLSSPTSPAPSFSGSITIDNGTGRYARARGSGHLYGVFYRRSYALTVQTLGSISY